MVQSAFGLLLQSLREERRLSLRELAQLAEVDHAYIYRLETGNKDSPSDEVLSKLVRALKPGKRESDMLRYLAKHTKTDSALVMHVLKYPTISFEIFASAAGAVFRGSKRPDPPELIERIRKIFEKNRDILLRIKLSSNKIKYFYKEDVFTM